MHEPPTFPPAAPDPLAGVRVHWERDDDALEEYDLDETLLPLAESETETQAPVEEASQPFVHLHVHSEYSLLDGLSSVHQITHEAKRQGMRALALTDHGNLYGAIDFYTAAKNAGVKPILGVEAYVSPRGMTERDGPQDRNYHHLVLLAKDLTGYRNLLKLVTRANLEGFYYKPRMDRALLAEHAEGLIALSGCYSGEPSRAVLDGNPKKARAAAGWYREVFGENYFLELQDHGNPDDQTVNRGLLEIHREQGIPIVCTNDLHYATAAQASAQDILLCVQTNSTIDEPKRMRMQPAAFYLKSPAEMWQLFGELPDALHNTVAIAERINLKLEFDRRNFPALDHLVPPGQGAQEFLARTCRERLPRRYGDRLTETHLQRLEYELDVIEKTGFATYILFVWDFVEWARQRGIPCGPRGSAAGSIILYCLSISDVDPIRYGLTFERFLNPERDQMPDIDMDFADDRREEVIRYVVERYGRERVAQIVTFGRLLARAAIRDVGRALDLPLSSVDRVAKLVPNVPGHPVSIRQAVEQIPELQQLYQSQPEVTKLIDTAVSVEGVARHAGTHAAGVVVADEPLMNYVPLQKPSKGEGQMTQYPMKVLEKIGLLKMDFLGLGNLTMLAKALDNIRQTRGIVVELAELPRDDPKTYEMLSRGETRTVFQLEGSGMTRYIQELKPSTVEHLAAMVALYRPGPMAHIPSYIARRDGREAPIPPDASLEDVLRESYGIIVYQDQVLQVVRKVAGYSLGQADVLRRAMGKKDKAVMAEEGPRFIAAAVEHGYARSTAERLWDLLQPFAGYAFNKAHAYCYAFLAFQTAYLKANYPVEWLAAVLTTVSADTDKVVSVVGECRRMGVHLLPPSVNDSAAHFSVEAVPTTSPATDPPALAIRYGLCAIKNVGAGAIELIVAERQANGAFRDLADFCRRQDLRTVNKRVLESLVKCGALDSLGGSRESQLAGLDAAMAVAQRDQRAASAGQTSLFESFGGDSDAQPHTSAIFALPTAAPVPPRERAAWEKEVLGFHFADHPFAEAAPWLRERVTYDLSRVTPEIGGERLTLAGTVTGVRKITTKTKGQMAVLTLEDLQGAIDVVVFPRAFEKTPALWREDAILVIEGRVDTRDERAQVLLERAEEWTPPPPGTPVPPTLSTTPQLHDPAVSYVAAGTSAGSSNGRRQLAESSGPGDGNPSIASAPPDAPRATSTLRVVVPRGDDSSCLRVLEQLHALVERYPGHDNLELVLHDRAGRQLALEGVGITLDLCADAVRQARALVGNDNIAVAPAR